MKRLLARLDDQVRQLLPGDDLDTIFATLPLKEAHFFKGRIEAHLAAG